MPFQFRDDIAHADIAFDAWGFSLHEVFTAAAEGTIAVMVQDLGTIQQRETVEVHIEQSDLEMLLFDFLNEIVFLKDARQLLLVPIVLSVVSTSEKLTLHATMGGEPVAPDRHQLITDVKAITMHRFSLRKNGERWEATVVLDV